MPKPSAELSVYRWAAEIRGRVVTFGLPECDEDAGAIPKLQELNRLAPIAGWETALRRLYDPEFVRYVTSPVRTGITQHFPIAPDAHILEIGPGLGQMTSALASRARFVDALEVVHGQAEFTAERMRQEGHRNVRVASGGADCRLPYVDELFDFVVLNLVFEWCAARSDEDHPVVQRRLLKEMHRVLRTAGRMYLATKNRFGISYLCGRSDEHFEGMRFGSALPRPVARALHGRRQSGFLHSWSGLHRMLADTGFEVERSWWAAPDYRYPTAMVDTSRDAIVQARQQPGFVAGRSRLERLVLGSLPPPLVMHVMPGLNFLSRKAGGTSLEFRI